MSKFFFTINGKGYQVDGRFGPEVSLNDYIRTEADLRGTKSMCHEGGCGACVVAVRAPLPPSNNMKIFAVNSCLVSVLSCHGWEVTTVEGIGSKINGYHDIQHRLAKFNGTQCGFCTPGWIMSMYSLYESKNMKLTSQEIENSFAANMCRCTGYRPIADAFKSFATDADKTVLDKICDLEDLGSFKQCGYKCGKKCPHKCGKKVETNDFVFANEDKMMQVEGNQRTWFRAYTVADVFKAMESGDYKLIAGNTGQGVYHITDYPSNLIDIFNVSELKEHTMDVNLVLGAGMPLTEVMQVFLQLSAETDEFAYLKQLYDHMDLVAHIPVRNIGTIGGNLYLKYLNKEFQSDLFVLFETVGGMLTIAESVTSSKRVTLPDFLKMDMKGKIIMNVLLPPMSKWCTVKTYKIMPRAQNAHAVVNAGFLFRFQQNSNLLEKATIVYGSISPDFIHASTTEQVLSGKDPYNNETLQLALKTLSEELSPKEAPPEPSAAYRKMLAIALYYKAILSLCPDDRVNPRFKSGGEAIKRQTSKGLQVFETDQSVWPLNQPVPKLEGLVQCSGEATFANDLPTQVDEVFAAFVTADAPPGSVISDFDASEAMKIPGVIAFYTSKDIPGDNSYTPTDIPFVTASEEVLCEKVVKFFGEPAGIIVADKEKTANNAAKLVTIKYSSVSSNKPLITIADVMASPEKEKRVKKEISVDPTDKGNDVAKVVTGEMSLGSQFHYYMEPQTSVARRTEDGMEIFTATQYLDLNNVAIARMLKIPVNSINVIVRRVGGSYGGKISRSVQMACACALVTHLLGRTCRFITPLMTAMKVVGKRIPADCQFEIGVNKEGEIQHLTIDIYQNSGCSLNESFPVLLLKPFQNCYDSKRWGIQGNSVISDTPSNTWCRAPFTTEAIAMIELIMEKIAFYTGQDPIDVRLKNMAAKIHEEVNPIPDMIEQIKKDAEFETRKKEVDNFNAQNRWRKRAIKILPIAIDMYYIGNLNSIVNIYHGDGSVVVIHGGIEMGQGLNTKVAQVCAYELGIPLGKVSVKSSTSFTSPNSVVTGGSVGSECVAYATIKACETLNERLKPFKDKSANSKWEDVVAEAYTAGINLQATYMYSPVRDDVETYYVYAVGMIEVELDMLTGNHDVRRVDILQDTGRSLSPQIDVAQIEGAFIMGLGYWTSEKLVYDPSNGKILTDRTWTYKPPGIKDIPADFRVYFKRNSRNKFGVLQSKPTGEPSLNLATVFVHATLEAIREVRIEAGYPNEWVDIEYPCTVENIFMAVGHKLEHFVLK